MSEYVLDATDAQLGDSFDARGFFGPRLKEEIVRCRDCQFWTPDPDPIDPGWPMWCERHEIDMVRPDEFCAWGERRESK